MLFKVGMEVRKGMEEKVLVVFLCNFSSTGAGSFF